MPPTNRDHSNLEAYRRALKALGPILFRHTFILVNGVIFAVVALLIIFGDLWSGVFIGIITCINILLGASQDFRARATLEKLQLITAAQVIRIKLSPSGANLAQNVEEKVYIEAIQKDDHIKLKLGDQVPCDGEVLSSEGLEVSTALITGESDSFTKKANDKVLAGSIVTAGTGIVVAATSFKDSRISKMTESAKKSSMSPSPIQIAVGKVILYSGYILIAVIAFVIIRGSIVHQPFIDIVKNIGALASIIVPQGLVVVTTLLFSFGSASYSRKHVLFQEINATEKLGRIKNLCLDKTGTLTDNLLTVESMQVYDSITNAEAEEATLAYLAGSADSSQTAVAVSKFLGRTYDKKDITEALPFSSWRHFGAVRYGDGGRQMVLSGSAETFTKHLTNEQEKAWLNGMIDTYTKQSKRILCVVKASDHSSLPLPKSEADITGSKLAVVAVYILSSKLREGIKDAIDFFQNRGITIRIISGDHPETVSRIAEAAGVLNTDKVITGADMQVWSEEDFTKKAREYTVFARVIPEVKVKLVEALKKDGFTAMVGDGANDALAIKHSDLGIAMFDGAPATRQLASVVLMNNSFTALPGGVELADNFISNLEIFSGNFINQSLLGLFFFVIISAFNYTLPITPLNVSMINQFALGFTGVLISYWAISMQNGIKDKFKINQINKSSFLSRVLPFVLASAVIESIGAAIVFMISPNYLKNASSNTLVLLTFALFGLIFFTLATRFYRGALTMVQSWQILGLIAAELAFGYIILHIQWIVRFFDINTHYPSWTELGWVLLVVAIFGLAQCIVTFVWSRNEKMECACDDKKGEEGMGGEEGEDKKIQNQ